MATLLLLSIAVAVITVTYAWLMAYMDNVPGDDDVVLYKENVCFDKSCNNTALSIGNAGASNVTIMSVFAGTSEITMQSYITLPASLSINASSVTTFTIPLTWWNNGTQYYFKIVPSSGIPLVFDQKSPFF